MKALAPILALSFALFAPAVFADQTESSSDEAVVVAERPLSKVVLTDGQELHARVIEQTDELVVLELSTGGRMELPASSVRSITAESGARLSKSGELRFEDPNRTRYLYTPSGMMLKAGEGYFSQKELFFSALAFGVTDNITILVGSVVPAFFLGANGLNLIGGVKIGGTVVPEMLHLAVGAETLLLPGLFGSAGLNMGGFVFGTATLGSRDAHLSVALGKPFVFSGGLNAGAFGDFLITVSGNYRVSRNVALVSENWFLPSITSGTSGSALLAPAVRIMGERMAVDIGGVWTVSQYGIGLNGFPIPWVDFTYNWG